MGRSLLIWNSQCRVPVKSYCTVQGARFRRLTFADKKPLIDVAINWCQKSEGMRRRTMEEVVFHFANRFLRFRPQLSRGGTKLEHFSPSCSIFSSSRNGARLEHSWNTGAQNKSVMDFLPLFVACFLLLRYQRRTAKRPLLQRTVRKMWTERRLFLSHSE